MSVDEMTRRDRDDLAKVARLRAKVARAEVTERQRTLLAAVEEQLSTEYTIDDAAWADITQAAKQAVSTADAQIAELCRQRGIPEQFRPELSISWYRRGENADVQRRAELRKTAQAKVAAAAEHAKLAIERRTSEVLTELLADGLTSGSARRFLESIPTPTELMPPVVVAELEGGAQ
jgi:hypothetical protein